MKNLIAAILANVLLILSAVFAGWAVVVGGDPQVLLIMFWNIPALFWLATAIERHHSMKTAPERSGP